MSKSSITPLPEANKRLLDLLSAIMVQHGHSFSMYTSKKSRMWLTLKGFEPTTYTTSAEHDPQDGLASLDLTFLVLVYRHWPKVILDSPPLNTWLTRRTVQDEVDEARTWLDALAERVELGTGVIYDIGPNDSSNAIERNEPTE